MSGRPGVIVTTAGPGATNALTGVAEAWADSIPILLLAGQVNADRLHEECGAYHEIDLESIFRPATVFCRTLHQLETVASLVDEAFDAMTSGRPRPSALILPQDLMKQTCHADVSVPPVPVLTPEMPRAEIEAAARLLSRASRPIVLAGGGALWGGAGEEVLALAERPERPCDDDLERQGTG